MPSINFDKTKGSKPIAVVKGGEMDKEVLYIHDEDNKTGGKVVKKEALAKNYSTELRTLKPIERVQLMNRLNEARRKDVATDALVGETALGKQLYERIIADESKSTEVELPEDSEFQVLPSPDPKKREVFYIAGASGSGKSYLARSLAEFYMKLHPDREVYLLSKLGEDETLDKMNPKPKRLKIQSFVDDYPEDLEEFRDCMIIFDDYDTFTGAEDKTIHKLIDDLATMGRHTNTTMLCLSHYLTNYKKTRLLLNEATHIIVYPQATSFHALGYLLKTHVGLSKDDVRDLKKMGRWVCVYKHYPQWLISKHHARLLNQ